MCCTKRDIIPALRAWSETNLDQLNPVPGGDAQLFSSLVIELGGKAWKSFQEQWDSVATDSRGRIQEEQRKAGGNAQ